MFSIFVLKGSIENVQGFYCDGVSAGLKSQGKLDLGFIYSDTACDVTFALTKNKFQAAPLKHLQKYPKDFQTNFILVSTKNANAMTGKEGVADIEEIFEVLGKSFATIQNPIMSSTGVIGVRLHKEMIIEQAKKFSLENKNGDQLSQAIMTSDAYPKSVCLQVKLDDGGVFHIGAVAKGAGMINPSLATMLCFICTDAAIPKNDMEELLENNLYSTFNAISVDGDTSTNDTVLLLANKQSGAYNKIAFNEALNRVMEKLALDIVSDGEGAKKCVAFKVTGSFTNQEAEIIAKALSNSLLVKTAIFGEDPNWGRIASTIGASSCLCDEDKLMISFNDVVVYKHGKILFDQEIEEKAAQVMKNESFIVHCDLGVGDGSFIAYGCDLGYRYVEINSDYRT